MNARARYARLLPVSGLALILLFGTGLAASQGTDKTIFVSVVDDNGKPVTDMTAADFMVREDTVDREIVSVKKSEQPLAIALLIDTTTDTEDYVSDIRNGVKNFLQQIASGSPESRVSIWEFGQASVMIRDFTNDHAALEKDAGRLFPKQRASSVLLEALYDSSEALSKQKTPRRAIVIVNIEPSNEVSSQQPQRILNSLLKSRTQIWAVSAQKGSLRNPQRDVVLNRLVQVGGGRREFIVTQSAIPTLMKDYADSLTSQYEVTYKRPSGKAQIVQVGVLRDGVKVLSGIAAPQ